MTQFVINGLFAVLCVVIGILGTLFIQFLLRKEKFKEIFYKERFSAYKETADCVLQLVAKAGTVIDIVRGETETADLARLQKERLELVAKIDQLRHCLWRNDAIISDSVLQNAHKALLWASALGDIVADRIGNASLEISDRAINLNTGMNAIISFTQSALNTMREELGIDKLSEETLKTIYYGSNLIRKYKGGKYANDIP